MGSGMDHVLFALQGFSVYSSTIHKNYTEEPKKKGIQPIPLM